MGFTILLLLVLAGVQCALGNVRQEVGLVFTSIPECDKVEGRKAHLLSELKTVQAVSSIDCARQCTEDTLCKSFNYNLINGSCQLNWDAAGGNCSVLSNAPSYRHRYYEQLGRDSDDESMINKVRK